MAYLNKAEALSRKVPPFEGAPLYVSGGVIIPVHQCLKCGFEWLAFAFKASQRPCDNCGTWKWTEPRESKPQKTRRSKHDKRTLPTE